MTKKFRLTEVPGDGGPRRSADDVLAEIRTLYFKTTAGTILRDFDRAIDLLKSIATPDERQRATVYMEGLAEMRKEWKGRTQAGKPRRKPRPT